MYNAAAMYGTEYSQNKQKNVEISFIQYYGRPKKLFNFNKLANYFIILFLNIIFIMKLYCGGEININHFNFNKRDLN